MSGHQGRRPPGPIPVLSASVLLMCLFGCGEAKLVPPLDQLEQTLVVTFPDDLEVIGGKTSSSSSLWLIASLDPLPRPIEDQPSPTGRTRRPKQQAGTPFPVSALSNLMAAAGVSAEDVPTFSGKRGRAIVGNIKQGHFCYREAMTEYGWLTAVEIHPNGHAPTEP